MELMRKAWEAARTEGIRGLFHKVLNYMRVRIDVPLLRRLYIHKFHKMYYYSGVWEKTYWLGVPVLKCPFDLQSYQEIIVDTKPDFIIETGTAYGGSALFFASIFDLVGNGKVITIDVEKNNELSHPRIIQIIGNSVSSEVMGKVSGIVNGGKAMVILDSDHRKEHVLRELRLYNKFVSLGCYLVVEDTNVNGHPVSPEFGPGPMEAVIDFLHENNDFIVDREREKFFLTFFPKGFLRRIR